MSMEEHVNNLLAELSGEDEFCPPRSDPAFLADWVRRAETALVFLWAQKLSTEVYEPLASQVWAEPEQDSPPAADDDFCTIHRTHCFCWYGHLGCVQDVCLLVAGASPCSG